MLTALIGVLCMQQQGSGQAIERGLDSWKAPKAIPAPPQSQLVQNIQLTGQWSHGGGLDHTAIDFGEVEPGSYTFTFTSSGCGGWWTLKRKATFSKGVIKFDRPVQEYAPLTYDRLYVMKVDGVTVLISPDNYRDFLSHHPDKTARERLLPMLAFRLD